MNGATSSASDSTYIIAELGQNHNGSKDIALAMIDILSEMKLIPDVAKQHSISPDTKLVNAIKTTIRDLDYELTSEQMLRPYSGRNSFGNTYGEHRLALELDIYEHIEISRYAKDNGLEFVVTLCAPTLVKHVKDLNPSYIKIASRDLSNLDLLEEVASTKVRTIISTGMADLEDIDNALSIFSRCNCEVSILHCTSCYPCPSEAINLRSIPYLIEKYQSNYEIGFSDHSIGILAAPLAVAMGAKIIEKHITIDRNMKGTDQKGSLALDGLKRMIRDIRNIEDSLGKEDMFISDSVNDSRIKLERSIASNKKLKKGYVLNEKDIKLLSPGDGFSWDQRENVIGKKLLKDIDANDIIYKEFIA